MAGERGGREIRGHWARSEGPPSSLLWVGSIGPDATAEDVRDLFSRWGVAGKRGVAEAGMQASGRVHARAAFPLNLEASCCACARVGSRPATAVHVPLQGHMEQPVAMWRLSH